MRKINVNNTESILRAMTTNNAICTISTTTGLNRMKIMNKMNTMNSRSIMIWTMSTTIIAMNMISTMNKMSYAAL